MSQQTYDQSTWINLDNKSSLFANISALIGAYLIMRLIMFVLERRRLHRTFDRMKVPCNRPHLISGHLYETRRQPFVHFAAKMHEQHGKNVGMFLGGDAFLLTTDLDLIQQVFVAKSRLFYNRMPFYLNVEPVPDNLICQRGDRWRYMRKVLSPFFANSKIKSSQFYWDAQRTFEKFQAQLNANSELTIDHDAGPKSDTSATKQVTLVADVYDRMAAIALDVICKTAFHMDDQISFEGPLNNRAGKCTVNAKTSTQDTFLATVKRACKLGFNPLVELIFCFPFLDPILTYICDKLVFATIVKTLFDRLNYLVRQQRMPMNQRKRIIDSLIDVLREQKISKNEFLGNALVIVFAGFETTANAFTFTLWLLAKHPEVQQKLRNELKMKMQLIRTDTDQQVTELELVELATGCEYLENVINESLRLYPPVPGLSGRQASVDHTLANGLHIEQGVTVLPSIWSIHRDTTIWGHEAHLFRPERFEVLEASRLNSAMFMPFGLGPRNCIGKALAMHEIKIIVGRLVLAYAIETEAHLTPDELRPSSPINITITNSDQIGLKFVKLQQ